MKENTTLTRLSATQRAGDVLDLATFQQSRFVYQHDLSSSWRHEQPGSQWQRPSTDLASLSLGSNSQRAPLLPLYHIIFVVVTRLPTASLRLHSGRNRFA